MADCVVRNVAEEKDNIQQQPAEAEQPLASAEVSQPTPPAAPEKVWLGFSGSYSHGIDGKGRMIIPASMRLHLGTQFAVAPTLDFKAIGLYPLNAWIEVRDMLRELTKKDAKAFRILDQFSKYSYTDSETDTQGRLLLPQKIRGWLLGEAKDVEVSGADTYIRVAESEVGKAQDEGFMDDYPDPLAFIAQLQHS